MRDYNYDREPFLLVTCRSRAYISKDTFLVSDTDGYVKRARDDEQQHIFGKAHHNAVPDGDEFLIDVKLNMAITMVTPSDE